METLRPKARQRVYTQVQTALTRGVLKYADGCEKCGSVVGLCAHHDDYAKPLAVRWLCASCHGRFHAALRAERARTAA